MSYSTAANSSNYICTSLGEATLPMNTLGSHKNPRQAVEDYSRNEEKSKWFSYHKTFEGQLWVPESCDSLSVQSADQSSAPTTTWCSGGDFHSRQVPGSMPTNTPCPKFITNFTCICFGLVLYWSFVTLGFVSHFYSNVHFCFVALISAMSCLFEPLYFPVCLTCKCSWCTSFKRSRAKGLGRAIVSS